MIVVALIVLSLAALPLWHLVATARAVRGEYLTGFHLVTAPIAACHTLALVLAIVAMPPASPPSWLLWVSLPGWFTAGVVLPFACFGPRRERLLRLATALAPLAVAAIALAPHTGPLPAQVGGWLVVGYAWTTVAVMASWWLVPRWRRFVGRFGARPPDPFQVQQAGWQREQWQRVPVDADVAALLPFVRSFAPEVAAASRARLWALPDAAAVVVGMLDGESAGDAAFALRQGWPGSRAALAPQLAPVLARARETWQERLRSDPAPDRSIGPALRLLDVALDVHLDGGDLGAELERWRQMFAAVVPLRDCAGELARALRRRR
jgi:hypothetical protein